MRVDSTPLSSNRHALTLFKVANILQIRTWDKIEKIKRVYVDFSKINFSPYKGHCNIHIFLIHMNSGVYLMMSFFFCVH